MDEEIRRIQFAILILAKAIEDGRVEGIVKDMKDILKVVSDL